MNAAVVVAVVAALANLLQGWDNATMAGKSFFFLHSHVMYKDYIRNGEPQLICQIE